MELNNNRHNILSSNISPNPMSVKYWADLSADPNGGVIKYHDGKKWELVNGNAGDKDIEALKKEVDKKVDKINGKQLSTEDYTTAEKSKLASLSNYNDNELRELISALTLKVGALEERVAALETPTV